jgi:hypothetical protein
MIYLLLYIQGFYFLVTGVWPVLDIKSFLKVTGPKKEVWLVKTFGLLISCIAAALIVAAFRKEASYAIVFLGVISALSLMFADVYYVKKGAIPSVYLLDAAMELIFLFLWLAVLI